MTDKVLRPAARIALQQIISNLSDGVILIEPDRTIGWANQAALDMHGVTTIAALGRTPREYRERFRLRYRNHHRLAAAHYPIDRVIAGESFDDVVVELVAAADPQRRWVHRVRGLVLAGCESAPECLAVILADITAWAEAEQRFEKTFQANPAPALICRLADLRYIKVNQGFLEMTGYTRGQVLERSIYELDVLEQAEARELAITQLEAGATIPQMEAELRLPAGERKLVIVAGQPIEVGDQACMLFSFMDLEPRRIAEQALRQSEERFAKAFRMTPVATLVCSAEHLRVLEVNQAFVVGMGYAVDEVLGKPLEQVGLFEPARAGMPMLEPLKRGGSLQNSEQRIRCKSGVVLDCLVSAETVSIQDATCYLLVLLDITERKRGEAELLTAIEEVMKDASWFSRTLIEKLANVRRGGPVGVVGIELAELTARERDALSLICEGLADKEIAARLGLAPNTVRNHVAALYSKLDVHSRSEAIIWARERGFFARPGKLPAAKKARRRR